MTHVYAYVKEGYSEAQIGSVIAGMKKAVCESMHLAPIASTVVVKEVAPECCSDNLGVFALVYTEKNKGLDCKKAFAAQMNEEIHKALPACGEVKIVMKEQAADMVGFNGILRYNDSAAMTAYEMGE